VIVEHYTVGTTAAGAWNTFAANTPLLGELPGTCAQFIVGPDGKIYQLVRVEIACRHTVGLNDVAIGIENVGLSASQVLRDKQELTASLHLTLWLMRRYGIPLASVIGHAESQTSPYYHDHLW